MPICFGLSFIAVSEYPEVKIIPGATKLLYAGQKATDNYMLFWRIYGCSVYQ
jgi:hypothetical protein